MKKLFFVGAICVVTWLTNLQQFYVGLQLLNRLSQKMELSFCLKRHIKMLRWCAFFPYTKLHLLQFSVSQVFFCETRENERNSLTKKIKRVLREFCESRWAFRNSQRCIQVNTTRKISSKNLLFLSPHFNFSVY